MKIHINGIGVALLLLALALFVANRMARVIAPSDYLVSYQFKQGDGVHGFGSAVISRKIITSESLPEIRSAIAPTITTNTSVSIIILNIVKLEK